MDNNGYVGFVCKMCDKQTLIKSQALKKRRVPNTQDICSDCYRKKFWYGYKYGQDYYPKEISDIWHDKVWPYERVCKLFPILKTKKQIEFKCELCGKIDRMGFGFMKRRKICGTKPICRKCAVPFATSSEEWRKKNSEAQLVSQNKPEVIEC